MQLQQAIKNVFLQLSDSVNQLSDEQYQRPSQTLFNATIGQHVRHIIELYICLYNGYETGIVNYDKRKRDTRIEQDKSFANELLEMIGFNLEKPDKDLVLESNYAEEPDSVVIVPTNFYREIIYNLEHTVHHMALIRVGINEVSHITVPEGFGTASSTIKYRKTCAQ
jgi:hypothetical protein